MEHEDIMWIEFAKTDLGVAEHLDKQYYPKPLEIICYHCQQAVEKAIPYSVSEIFFPLRINNITPSSSSNAAICLDSVGWVICNCSAAFVKLCSFATVKK